MFYWLSCISCIFSSNFLFTFFFLLFWGFDVYSPSLVFRCCFLWYALFFLLFFFGKLHQTNHFINFCAHVFSAAHVIISLTCCHITFTGSYSLIFRFSSLKFWYAVNISSYFRASMLYLIALLPSVLLMLEILALNFAPIR